MPVTEPSCIGYSSSAHPLSSACNYVKSSADAPFTIVPPHTSDEAARVTTVDERSPSARPLPPRDASASAKKTRPGGSAVRPKHGIVLRDIEALPYDAIAAARRGNGPSLA